MAASTAGGSSAAGPRREAGRRRAEPARGLDAARPSGQQRSVERAAGRGRSAVPSASARSPRPTNGRTTARGSARSGLLCVVRAFSINAIYTKTHVGRRTLTLLSRRPMRLYTSTSASPKRPTKACTRMTWRCWALGKRACAPVHRSTIRPCTGCTRGRCYQSSRFYTRRCGCRAGGCTAFRRNRRCARRYAHFGDFHFRKCDVDRAESARF